MKKFLTALTILLLFQFSGTISALDDCKSDRKRWSNCIGTKKVEYVNDSATHSGSWRNNKPHGQGTTIFEGGNKHEGEFKNGKRHGQGTYTWADGRQYVGEWKDGKMHGQGTNNSADGRKYVGEWKDNRRDGQGTYTWTDGDQYVGEWKSGLRNGQGTYTWADGRKYVGEWKDSKHHGQGTLTYASGKIQEGFWEDNEYIGSTAIKIHSDPSENTSGPSENTKYLFILIILIIIIISGIVLVNKSKTDPIKTHNSNKANTSSDKDFLPTMLLCFFLGGLGIHRFFVGKRGTGILMLITFGGLGIWWLIDLIMIAIGSFKDIEGRAITYQSTNTTNTTPGTHVPEKVVETPPAKDISAEIEKLADLKDKGIITDEEFQQKKQELLDRI